MLLPVLVGAVLAAAPAVPAPDLRTARVVDLSHAFDEQTVVLAHVSPRVPQGDGCTSGRPPAASSIPPTASARPSTAAPTSTRPSTSRRAGGRPTQIPVERLVRPAVVIDVSSAAAADPDHRIERRRSPGVGVAPRAHPRRGHRPAAHGVERALARPQALPGRRHAGRRVPAALPVLRRGGGAAPGPERSVAALGVDTASIDYGPRRTSPSIRSWPRPTCWVSRT